MIEALVSAGLTRNESRVYMAVLELGSATPAEISQKCGVHRRSVHDVLNSLSGKGLISCSALKNRKLFQAKEPGKILELLNSDKEGLAKLMPVMISKYKCEAHQTINFFRGEEGLKAILNDEINTGKPIFVFGAADVPLGLKDYFGRYYDKRKKRRIPLSLLFSEALRGKTSKIPLSRVRFLPEEYVGPATVEIYGNKIAIVLWKDDILIISINNREIAESYRNYFMFLWDVGRR